jgi:hypothetical protein
MMDVHEWWEENRKQFDTDDFNNFTRLLSKSLVDAPDSVKGCFARCVFCPASDLGEYELEPGEVMMNAFNAMYEWQDKELLEIKYKDSFRTVSVDYVIKDE